MTKLWRGLSEDGQTITLRKFNGTFDIPAFVTPEWIDENRSAIVSGVVVDVETTGLDVSQERVIEIGMRPFQFHKTAGHLVSVGQPFSGFQDPGKPLSLEISEITGITDEQLRGQRINWTRVKEVISQCKIVIAHNADFDRQFIEKELGEATRITWACSFKQMEWSSKGYGIQKLELLSAYHGFFTDAHRALNDADALLNLLSHADLKTGRPYLAELFFNAHRLQTKILAAGAPFETKDLLKRRGYRWDAGMRCWFKIIYRDQLEPEVEWLKAQVYPGKFLGRTEDLERAVQLAD